VTVWLAPPASGIDLERELAALLPRVVQLESTLLGVAGELRKLDARLSEAGSTLHEGLGSLEGVARSADEALRRTAAVELASRDLAARVRAATLLALATRLRRDVDVGAPLAEDALLLSLHGPYPPAVERAVEGLARLPDGTLTMRDLAVGYEVLEARIQARADLDLSWPARGWGRVSWLFGSGPADTEAAIAERLHVLAADGRFNETADLLERSLWKDLGAAWIGQVRDRARAVLDAQVVTAHAAAISRAAQAGAGDPVPSGTNANPPRPRAGTP
jgi:hypothetical protein